MSVSVLPVSRAVLNASYWRGRKARRAWCEAPATPVLLFQQVSSHEAHNSRGTFALTPPNKPLKPARPGAGPAAEPPTLWLWRGVTPADMTLAPLNAARTLHPSRRSGFGTRALAARLSGMAVRRTTHMFRIRTLATKLRYLGATANRPPRRCAFAFWMGLY